MIKNTTIKVSKEVRDELSKLRLVDGETLESVIKRLIEKHDNKPSSM